MGERGRVPNPDRDRRERKHGWITIPPEPVERPAPELKGGHSARGRDQWAAWWAMPVSTMWSPVIDAGTLERLLSLYETVWELVGDPLLLRAAPLTEIRNLEDRFGLTPMARRRLCWQVAGVDVPAETPDRLGNDGPAQVVPAAGGAADPRRLRAVN